VLFTLVSLYQKTIVCLRQYEVQDPKNILTCSMAIGGECTDVCVKHTARCGQTNFVMIPVGKIF